MRILCAILAAVSCVWIRAERASAIQLGEAASPVVAEVNGESVTRAELQRMLANPLTRQDLRQDLDGRTPDSKALERFALRRLIQRRLMLQEADRRKITVTDKELDEAIARLRLRFDDLKSFGAWMKGQGLGDHELFESVRGDMLADRVRAALVEGTSVPSNQVRAYYHAHKNELKTQEVRLQIIVVKDKAAAQEILETALQQRTDFGRLARERSLGKRAAQGGDTGWIDAATLSPALRELVDTLNPRQATGPLQRGDEFLVVRLHDRRPGRVKTLDEARSEVERRLLRTAHERVVQAWLEEREKHSKIEMIVPGH